MLDVVNSGGGGGSSGGGGGQSLIDDSLLESVTAGSPSAEDLLGGGASRDGAEEWNYDPSEPRYCVCNQVSYGDMVACDNVDVRGDIELSQHGPAIDVFSFSARMSGFTTRVWG